MKVKIKRLSADAVIPKYAKAGDSGFDLVATEELIILPGETVKVPIGLAFEIQDGFELQIRPRSGVSAKTKLRVQFGTIDSGYRGEVSVTVDNALPFSSRMVGKYALGLDGTLRETESYSRYLENTYVIRKGDRIAQGVIAPVVKASFEEVDELSVSERGVGGFGHTGVTA